jgi:hypothetical protein
MEQQQVPTDKAVKFDAGKLPYHLIPWDAMDSIVAVLRFGAAKYGERNWEQGGSWSRDFGALMRHMTAYWQGQDLDLESGLPHLAHAGCCVLFMLAYFLRKIGTDNRPKTDQTPFCCVAHAKGEAHQEGCEFHIGTREE